MEKFRQTIIDSEGNIIPLATVNVFDTGTENAVLIFSDDGVTSESNPFTTGSDAVLKFYAADGRYDIKITKTGFDDILVVDQQLFDRNATTQNGGLDNVNDTIIGADSDGNGTGDILLKIGGSTQLQLKNNSDFDIKTGNLIISGASKGIDFSATTGSSDPDVLDKYIEGTWTPTVSSGTAAGVTGAIYTKIGNVVHFQVRLVNINASSGSTAFTIGGLPFVSSDYSAVSLSQLQFINWGTQKQFTARVNPSSDTIGFIWGVDDGAVENVTQGDLDNAASGFMISGTYNV